MNEVFFFSSLHPFPSHKKAAAAVTAVFTAVVAVVAAVVTAVVPVVAAVAVTHRFSC